MRRTNQRVPRGPACGISRDVATRGQSGVVTAPVPEVNDSLTYRLLRLS